MIKVELVIDGNTFILGEYIIYGTGDLDEVYRVMRDGSIVIEVSTLEQAISYCLENK